MRLVIAEKPFFARMLQDTGLIPPDTEIVFTFGFGLWRYTLPKISFADIPFSDSPSELRPFNFAFNRYLVTATGETLFSVTEESTPQDRAAMLDSLLQYLRKRIHDYEEIICAVDPDRTGYGAARQLLEQINPGMAAPVPVHCLYLQALDERSVRDAWEARAANPWAPKSRAQSLADTQMAKQTFDYWWNANSSVVFSELCHWVNVKADPLISKYELMLMAVIADTPSIPVGKLLTAMQDWQGTGKYARAGLHGAIGSPASRHAILDSAIARGMVSLCEGDKPNRQLLRLTPAGDAFMSRLHPRTYDPDLPFRLEQWITAGDYASMRRYINTVFSRQLRYQRRQLTCSISQSVITSLHHRFGIGCLLQKTSEVENRIDRITLVSADNSQRLAIIEISACSGGSYRVQLDRYPEKSQYTVHAAGDEELGGLSIPDFIEVIGNISTPA